MHWKLVQHWWGPTKFSSWYAHIHTSKTWRENYAQADILEWVKIRNGTFDFDLCLCHDQSFQALVKAKVAPILGPKGLMPSTKMGTVVKNPASAISDLVGKASYRERLGVVRMAIGQLAFTEEQLKENIKAFMSHLKKNIANVSQVSKSVAEVVLSSTHSPGFSLNGLIKPKSDVD